MSNNQKPIDDAQLDRLLNQASNAQREAAIGDERLKARILARVSTDTQLAESAPTSTTWLDVAWQWFAHPMRLAAGAALPLLVGFVLGNATLITDSELLVALSEQDSWPHEQMLDDTQWSEINE